MLVRGKNNFLVKKSIWGLLDILYFTQVIGWTPYEEFKVQLLVNNHLKNAAKNHAKER